MAVCYYLFSTPYLIAGGISFLTCAFSLNTLDSYMKKRATNISTLSLLFFGLPTCIGLKNI
jgi:hypothetical protein